eukprot:GFYU01004531.1.p1 GENE.GFYU01004531.1~~GFYU01004531.1.p1  ORF type:complete len:384 (+),score=71.21 GFYU01004531.1:150-1301(+)
MALLNEARIATIKSRKYAGYDVSITLNLILKHFYEFLMSLMPRWIAPNFLTLTGFAAIMGACAMYWTMNPSLADNDAVPRWMYFFLGGALFFYQTLDNLDGKQARKTGFSSPSGELLDHGCDAICCWVVASVYISTLQLGDSMLGTVLIYCGLTPFAAANWEQFHTGALGLGYINGAIEGILLTVICFVTTGIFGTEVWTMAVKSTLGLNFEPVADMQLNHFVLNTGIIAVLMTIGVNVFHVTKSYANNKVESRGVFYFTRQFIPFATLLISSCLWLHLSPSNIMKHHILLFYINIGLVFCRIATGITLAAMCGEHVGLFRHSIPMLMGAANVLLGAPIDEYYYLVASVTIASALYISFVVEVVQEFEQAFTIYWVFVPTKKD